MWTIKLKSGIEIKASELEYDGNYFDYKDKFTLGSIQKDLVESIKNELGTIYRDEKPMKKVIRLDEPKEESKKPIELTHYTHSKDGWVKDDGAYNRSIKKIVFLGECKEEGDLFAVYFKVGTITFFKGYLNDGVY